MQLQAALPGAAGYLSARQMLQAVLAREGLRGALPCRARARRACTSRARWSSAPQRSLSGRERHSAALPGPPPPSAEPACSVSHLTSRTRGRHCCGCRPLQGVQHHARAGRALVRPLLCCLPWPVAVGRGPATPRAQGSCPHPVRRGLRPDLLSGQLSALLVLWRTCSRQRPCRGGSECRRKRAARGPEGKSQRCRACRWHGWCGGLAVCVPS